MGQQPVTIDFETYGIESRPLYPPKPVGVSIKPRGKKSFYWAFGHPTANNCSKTQAIKALRKVWRNPGGLLFHNGKFDLDVAQTHMGLSLPSWQRYHDTMFLTFLDDPHQTDISLKGTAERLLRIKPEERDTVKEWLLKHQPVHGVKISESKESPHYFMKYIAYAPGDVVGPYANGDVKRTEGLFIHLHRKTLIRQMGEAYDRERKLMFCLLDMERRGIAVDHKRLRADTELYKQWRATLDLWLIKTLKCSPDIKFNSGAQLVAAMIKVGKVDKNALGKTKTGRLKTDKDSLLRGIKDKQLLGVLQYRSRLNTCLNTFMTTWLKMADASGGKIFTTWNQTKLEHGDGTAGTRTGRLSSTPNFQNIPQTFPIIFRHEAKEKPRSFPICPFNGLPPLPLIRSYVVPSGKGRVLIDRDYSQQEVRVLGHFENGALMEAYKKDPRMDVHEYAGQMLSRALGKPISRKIAKTMGFALIYGMGIALMAERLGMPVDEAKVVKKTYLALFPGLKSMYDEMRMRHAYKKPIRTWGGREVYCEPDRFIDGRLVSFDYKMVNYLIQGSSADCTKQAIIDYYEHRPRNHYLILNVHDQLTVDCPKSEMSRGMGLLKKAMEKQKFDVEMLSDGKWSDKNWAAVKAWGPHE